MRVISRIIFLLVVITTLPSCIIIEDFGVYWNRGIADSDVVGKWQRRDGAILEFFEEDGSLIMDNGQDKKRTHFRTIKAAGYKFFLIREEKGDGILRSDGAVMLYQSDEKNLYRFGLNQESENLEKDLMAILKKSGFIQKDFTGSLELDRLDDTAFMAGVSFLKKPEHLKKIIHMSRFKDSPKRKSFRKSIEVKKQPIVVESAN